MRVTELSKRVGRIPRKGVVIAVEGSSVRVRWDDGHESSTTGPLFPVKDDATTR